MPNHEMDTNQLLDRIAQGESSAAVTLLTRHRERLHRMVSTHMDRRLAARLDNLRALDYPPARRQIIVVSDGSTDDTAAVVAGYRPFVELVEVRLAARLGGLLLGLLVLGHGAGACALARGESSGKAAPGSSAICRARR